MPTAGQIFYVPHVTHHSTLEPILYDEVKGLEEAERIRPCNFDDIRRFRGQGIATICSDPSLFEVKLKLVNTGGQMAIMSDPGISLELDPNGPFYSAYRESKIVEFVTLKPELKEVLLMGAHYRCAHAECVGGLSLTDYINVVAAGARHMRGKHVFKKVIATIFILVKMPDSSAQLKWYHIPKNGH